MLKKEAPLRQSLGEMVSIDGHDMCVYTEGEGKSSAAASMIGRTGKADLVGARKKRSDTANESEKGQSAAAGAPAKKSAHNSLAQEPCPWKKRCEMR